MLLFLTPFPTEIVQKEITKQMMAQWAIVHAVFAMNIRMTELTLGYSRLYVASR